MTPPQSLPRERAARPAPARRRLLLVDDHPMMRAGLAMLLDGTPDLEAGGEAGTAAEALAWLGDELPAAVILDLTLPDRNGLALLAEIRARHPDLPVLVVSMHDEQLYASRAREAGARGYVMKEAGGARLLEAIRQVLAGHTVFAETISPEPESPAEPSRDGTPLACLTQREYEVFLLLGQGLNTRTIATRLGLSSKTVDVHRANIKEKLELRDLPGLIRQAVRWVETGRFDR